MLAPRLHLILRPTTFFAFRSLVFPFTQEVIRSSDHKQRFQDGDIARHTAPLRGGTASKRGSVRRRIGASPEQQQLMDSKDCINVVVAACTAQTYCTLELGRFLERTFIDASCIQEDVWYVRIVNGTEAFFFSDGCFVLWGPQSNVLDQLSRFENELRPFENGKITKAETETLFFRQSRSDKFYAGTEGETIIIEGSGSNESMEMVLSKLAFSNGLADSVKLAVLENSLDEHIERVKPIPLALANGGKLTVGRAEVLRLTGELLKFRADLNLHSELTDTPDMYWSEPQLEELYHRIARVLDIRHRARILNKRLDYANELAAVLRSHLSEQHGLKLEWGIIALIAVEVAFETLHWVVKLGGAS